MSDQNRASTARRGFSLIEMLIVITIILLLIGIAAPRYKQSMRLAHETAAIAAIQTLNSMQVQYYSQFGRYATSLAELGPPQSGAAGASAADLIDGSLAAGSKSGYKFTLSANQSGYTVNASPEVFNTSGARTFFSDQNMTIHVNDGQEPATANSKELK